MGEIAKTEQGGDESKLKERDSAEPDAQVGKIRVSKTISPNRARLARQKTKFMKIKKRLGGADSWLRAVRNEQGFKDCENLSHHEMGTEGMQKRL